MKIKRNVDSTLDTLWSRVTLVCGNHGNDYSHVINIKEVHRSEFYEGRRHDEQKSDPFYACPEYKPYYDVYLGEKSCNNRMPYTEFEKLLTWIKNEEDENAIFGEQAYIAGYEHKTKSGITFRILKQEEKDGLPYYTVSMLNKRAIHS